LNKGLSVDSSKGFDVGLMAISLKQSTDRREEKKRGKKKNKK